MRKIMRAHNRIIQPSLGLPTLVVTHQLQVERTASHNKQQLTRSVNHENPAAKFDYKTI